MEYTSIMVALGALFIMVVGGFIGISVNFGSRLGKLENGVLGLVSGISNVEHRFDRLEDIVAGLTAAVSHVSERMSNVEGQLSPIDTRLGLVESKFSYAGNSPIKLTPVGQKIFDDVNGSAYVDKHYDELKEIVRTFGMDTKYDVQQNSIIAIEKLVDEETLNAYKAYAYKEGKRLEQIFEAVGVYLRDRVLEEQDNS